MKDSGIPWIGEIPEGWSVENIGAGLKEINSPNRNCIEDNALQFKMGTIISKKFGNSKYNPETLEGYNQVKKGDIIINGLNLSFDFISKRIGLVQENGAITSTYLAVRPQKHLNSRFTTYLLKSYDACKVLHGMGKGLRQTLTYGEFKKYKIFFPPFSEQQKIADYLDRKCSEIDKMIVLEEKVIEELKAYKQSVITEAVTKGLNPDVPMKDSGIEWIGKIPEHWNTSKLKKIANKRVEKSNEPNLNYIGLENLVSFSEEMVETENIYSTEGANVCCEGDVIFGKLRPYLGKVKVIKDRCYCSTEFLVLKNNDCPKYLRYLMLSEWFIEIVNASTYGTKMPRANTDFILNMSVPIPPLDDKKNIVSYLENKCSEIDSLVSIKNSKIKELKDYKKSIIYEYVTGKREVQ